MFLPQNLAVISGVAVSLGWLTCFTHTAASFTLQISMFTGNASAGGIDDDDDDVPMLVEDFEAASKTDTGEYWL